MVKKSSLFAGSRVRTSWPATGEPSVNRDSRRGLDLGVAVVGVGQTGVDVVDAGADILQVFVMGLSWCGVGVV